MAEYVVELTEKQTTDLRKVRREQHLMTYVRKRKGAAA